MFGLAIIGGVLLAVVFVGLLLLEVTFWVVVAVTIAGIALALWSLGLFEALGAVALFGVLVWAIYRLVKWDLGRLGQEKHEEVTDWRWRLYRLMNWEFGRPSLQRPAPVRTPPKDPSEKRLWANRLGPYTDDAK